MKTIEEGVKSSKRLHIRDRTSGQTFLIDSGANISLFPVDSKFRNRPSQLKLFAANDTSINTFGKSLRTLNLGLKREIRWSFCIADVPYPIIGADLLWHYGFLVDLRNSRLIANTTKLYSLGIVKDALFHSITSIAPQSKCVQILAEFPEITSTSQLKPPKTSEVYHHITTSSAPVFARPCRLAPDKFKTGKEAFRAWMAASICEPSSSPWASPIHMAALTT